MINCFTRPLMQDERKYTFRSCTEIEVRSGLIGCMAVSMSSTFEGADKKWCTVNERLKTETFNMEFREILTKLNYTIPNKESLRVYFNTHHRLIFYDSGKNHYNGMRILTEKYCYLIRIHPSRDTENVMIFCYEQDCLKRHIRNATRGICFVDKNNNEICSIRDGECIRLLSTNFEQSTPIPCRYIDPFTCQIGSKVWNIKDFTEHANGKGRLIVPV